ncbi:hypothetical protein [Actinacidiphila sp. ITFR-21]|uniref:hypothetical protein n=1 Tax=Actinacidiphila sp. ITFR-21 TaxID=3075199 RepID=UPI00288B38AC|nr:hypothetical protein [Streptomyces sp. ITFR-21]WNI16251.1 hypothetical protein RLT57_12390 [Streptomyces sp. ITFR-21]
MSVNVRLADVLAVPGSLTEDPRQDDYADASGTHYDYEILPGGALAVLEFQEEQVRTATTYAPGAWLTVTGKRRGDQR